MFRKLLRTSRTECSRMQFSVPTVNEAVKNFSNSNLIVTYTEVLSAYRQPLGKYIPGNKFNLFVNATLEFYKYIHTSIRHATLP